MESHQKRTKIQVSTASFRGTRHTNFGQEEGRAWTVQDQRKQAILGRRFDVSDHKPCPGTEQLWMGPKDSDPGPKP